MARHAFIRHAFIILTVDIIHCDTYVAEKRERADDTGQLWALNEITCTGRMHLRPGEPCLPAGNHLFIPVTLRSLSALWSFFALGRGLAAFQELSHYLQGRTNFPFFHGGFTAGDYETPVATAPIPFIELNCVTRALYLLDKVCGVDLDAIDPGLKPIRNPESLCRWIGKVSGKNSPLRTQRLRAGGVPLTLLWPQAGGAPLFLTGFQALALSALDRPAFKYLALPAPPVVNALEKHNYAYGL